MRKFLAAARILYGVTTPSAVRRWLPFAMEDRPGTFGHNTPPVGRCRKSRAQAIGLRRCMDGHMVAETIGQRGVNMFAQQPYHDENGSAR